jgi:HK97 family phage major capsid protein
MAGENIDLAAVTAAVAGIKSDHEAYKATMAEMVKKEIKGAVDPLLEEKLAKIDAEMSKKQELIDALYTANRRKSITLDGQPIDEADLDRKALEWADQTARRRGTRASDFGAKELAGYKAQFGSYLRKGDQIMGAEEMKALSVGSDPDGGFVVTPDTSGRIVKKVFETSPMRAYASVQVISTDALEGMYDLGEAGYEWVGETGARSATTTPQFGQWRIPVHELSAMPKATQKLLDDASIDIEAWLANKVADRFARAEATAFVTGDGTNKPRGFLTYASGTTLPGTLERFDTGVNGAFAAAPSGGDVLISALYGLKAQYRANATWFMNRTTLTLLRKLKDSNGAYLWAPGIGVGQPSTVLGYPLASFEDMPDPATDSLSIAVGDMAAAYQIVERTGIRVLRDPFTAKPHVLFYTTKRVGGDVVNFEALKLIEFTA